LQSVAEKNAKQFETQATELNIKLEQAQREIQELNNTKNRGLTEVTELARKLEENEGQVIQLGKAKQALAKSLEEARAAVEEESRLRLKAQAEARNFHADLEQLRQQLEEEQNAKADFQRLLQKANSEAVSWKQKFDSGAGGVKSEEVEELKKKLGAKLLDTESQLEAALSKVTGLEKSNYRLRAELEDMSIEVERVCIFINAFKVMVIRI
jgi:chromosome segregation ATPase